MDNTKKKKSIFKKWWFWVVIVFVIIIAASLGGNNPSDTATANPQLTASPTPKITAYGDGQYKVGADIPSGEYVLISSTSAYFETAKDSTGNLSSIIANDNFTNRSIITVSDGQYIKLSKCKMYKFEDAPAVTKANNTLPEGMYKTGVDLAAGEYKIVSDGGSAYVEVSSDSAHTLDSIVSNSNFSGEQYITVKDGQYLKLSNAHLNLK